MAQAKHACASGVHNERKEVGIGSKMVGIERKEVGNGALLLNPSRMTSPPAPLRKRGVTEWDEEGRRSG